MRKTTKRRAARTCLCTAGRAAAAVVAPGWARENNVVSVNGAVPPFDWMGGFKWWSGSATHADSFFGFDGHVVGLGWLDR